MKSKECNKVQTLSIEKKYSISVEEACEYTGIGENAMYSLIKREGTKFCCRIGDRKCVIIRHKLEEFLDSHYDLTA